MLLQQNGSEIQPHSYSFPITELSRVGEARRFASVFASAMKLDEVKQGRLSIIVNELGNNLIKYTTTGELLIRKISAHNGSGVEVLAIDRGPGMNASVAIADGYTTGTTPGTGLGAIQRQADYFDIYSEMKRGTVIVAGIADSKILNENSYSVGAVNIPYKGDAFSGDGWCVFQDKNQLNILVTDGLGHGPLANKAAAEASEVFAEYRDLPIEQLLDRIHGRLKSTRGGAVFILQAIENNIIYSGLGNIRSIIQRQDKAKALISQNGTAGVQMRKTKPMQDNWSGDDILIFHTDGIHTHWELSDHPGLIMRHPSIIAAVIYRDHARGNDDSTILVIRRKR